MARANGPRACSPTGFCRRRVRPAACSPLSIGGAPTCARSRKAARHAGTASRSGGVCGEGIGMKIILCPLTLSLSLQGRGNLAAGRRPLALSPLVIASASEAISRTTRLAPPLATDSPPGEREPGCAPSRLTPFTLLSLRAPAQQSRALRARSRLLKAGPDSLWRHCEKAVFGRRGNLPQHNSCLVGAGNVDEPRRAKAIEAHGTLE